MIPGKHNKMQRTLLESQYVQLQGYKLDSKTQIIIDFDHDKVGHMKQKTDIRYLLLTARRVETEQAMLRN